MRNSRFRDAHPPPLLTQSVHGGTICEHADRYCSFALAQSLLPELCGGEMQFRAEQYYRVSLERMRQARKIYDDASGYALAMYCGGLAVESLLRAFRWTE